VGTDLEIRLLGPLEVVSSGKLVPITAPKHRILLASLALNANRSVSAEQLIDQLWDTSPPAGARDTLYTYVTRLRRTLFDATGAEFIVTRRESYLLEIEDDALDLSRFERLVRQARTSHADASRTAALLHEALALWRGEPLSDVPSEVLRRELVPGLREQLVAATELRIDADLRLGRHSDVVAELRELTVHYPLRERFWSQRMLALYRSERQVEALECYQAVRRLLADELGIDPGPELRDLHKAILANDPGLTPVAVAPARPAGRNDLPGDIPDFVGRDDEIRHLAETPPAAGTTVVISAIDGMAGIGKTALAVHLAHRLADRYPDGRLFIDLNAHTEGQQPTTAEAALETLLRAIDTPADRIPATLDERAALWRATLADRQVLVVLDNAANATQVRPLLPGAPGCLVIVTSRRRLSDLDTANTLSLDVLPPEQAQALFTRVVGPSRSAAEPDAVAEVLRLCGYLPLAIRIAASRLRTRPSWTVAHLVGRLRDEQRRLSELAVGERSVAAAFTLSYEHLTADQQRLFRLLGLVPGPSFDAYVAAALLDTDVTEADRLLEDLVDAHLLQSPEPGRYRFHDLLRDHARAIPEQVTHLRVASNRLLDYYLAVTRQVAELIAASRKQVTLAPCYPPKHIPVLSDRIEAVAWCQREHANLVAAIGYAAHRGWHVHTWQLAHTLWHYFDIRFLVEDWITTHRMALAAAESIGDDEACADTLQHLACAYNDAGEFTAALDTYADALVLYRKIGDQRGEANALHNMAMTAERIGRAPDALKYIEQCLALRRSIGDPWNEAHTVNILGVVHQRLTNYEEANFQYQIALNLYRSVGDTWGESMTLSNIADILRLRGQHAEALRYHRQALDLAQTIGDVENIAELQTSLATTCYTAGLTEEAAFHFQQVLTLAEDIGSSLYQARALAGLGDINQNSDSVAAREYRLRALAIYTSLGVPEAQKISEILER
jgi:DNA-binding SARP family transcriptional activator